MGGSGHMMALRSRIPPPSMAGNVGQATRLQLNGLAAAFAGADANAVF